MQKYNYCKINFLQKYNHVKINSVICCFVYFCNSLSYLKLYFFIAQNSQSKTCVARFLHIRFIDHI